MSATVVTPCVEVPVGGLQWLHGVLLRAWDGENVTDAEREDVEAFLELMYSMAGNHTADREALRALGATVEEVVGLAKQLQDRAGALPAPLEAGGV